MTKAIAEGKTKVLFRIAESPGILRVVHKIDITAGDGEKHNTMEGKDVAACQTTSNVFSLLESAGIPTHYISDLDGESLKPNEMLVRECDMIKLEVVARRVATGSYLKRNPNIKEGTRFVPLVVEFFLKDDDRHDPLVEWDPALQNWVYWQASRPRNSQSPQKLEETFKLAKTVDSKVVASQLPTMSKIVGDVFEVLERAWWSLDIQLVDVKIEFGFSADGRLVVADVIDNDSWRIWPGGDKRLQLDKQTFREMDEVTADSMKALKKNYEIVAELTFKWSNSVNHCVVILVGSKSDQNWANQIRDEMQVLGLNSKVEFYSADKTPLALHQFVQETDVSGEQIIYISVSGRRNALGGIDLHTTNPVINCPPEDKTAYAIANIISSLEMPSGIGALTVKYPEAAAIAAAKIIALRNLLVWCKLRSYQTKVREQVRRC